MAARLAEAEGKEGVSEERLDEEKAVALKGVYGGVSRVLQQYGEKRWRAAEVAMVLRAEVQFVLSGERPEVNIEQEEEKQEREQVTEKDKVAVVQERLSESQLSSEREEEGDRDSSTKADDTAAVGDDEGRKTDTAAGEEEASSKNGVTDHTRNGTDGNKQESRPPAEQQQDNIKADTSNAGRRPSTA